MANQIKTNSIFFKAPKSVHDSDRYLEGKVDKRDGRTDFAIDRDRILYSNSFRRLSGKTQVFLSDNSSDLRTRLTHTLEVNQIAKTIVSSLACNLELTEAIALGHDVGHTPFGHVGERTLNLIMNGCESVNIRVRKDNLGFKHNIQSARILCEIENLNLTKYTLWGIVNHSKLEYKDCEAKKGICYSIHHPDLCCKCQQPKNHLSCEFYNNLLDTIERDKYWSIEGLVVALADEIAQRHHDIEDSLRFSIISRMQLIEKLKMFEPIFSPIDIDNFKVLKSLTDAPLREFLSQFSRMIVKMYVVNLTESTKERISQFGKKYGITGPRVFESKKEDMSIDEVKTLVDFCDEFNKIDKSFHDFLKSEVLNSYAAQSMDGKGAYIVRRLFEAYLSNPIQLPDDAICRFFKEIKEKTSSSIGEKRGAINQYRNNDTRRNTLMRVIADYIGSMTDSYAYNQFDRLYGTKI